MGKEKFDVREETYPSGAKFYDVYLRDKRLGSYEPKDGGFVLFGCRKVIGNERDAQLRVIQKYVAARLKQAKEAAALFSEFGSEV